MKKFLFPIIALFIGFSAVSQIIIKPINITTITAETMNLNGTSVSNSSRICPNQTISFDSYIKTFALLKGTTTYTPVSTISGYTIQWYYKRHYSAPTRILINALPKSLNAILGSTKGVIIKETIDTTNWIPISGGTSPSFNFAYNTFFTSYYDKTYLRFTVTYSNITRTSDSITILRSTKPLINNFAVLPYYCPGKVIDVAPDVSVYNKYADTIVFGWQRATYSNGVVTGIYNSYIDSIHLAISPADFNAYDYQLTASNSCGSAVSESLHSKVVAPTQAVNEQVAISPLISSINTCIGSQGTIPVQISPINSGLNYTYLYSWEYYNGSSWNVIDAGLQSIYSNFKSGTLSIVPPNTSINGYIYRCRVTGLCANPVSTNVQLNVKTPASVTSISSPYSTICRDSLAQLNATATGSTPIFYRWITGNYVSTWLTTANSFSYPVGEVNQDFRVEVKNDYCTDFSPNFKKYTISVYDVPSVNLFTTFSSCNGTNGNVSSQITGGKTPYSYSWNNGQTTSYLLNVPPSTYSLVVKDACKLTANQSIAVSQLPALAVSINPINVSCYGQQNGSISVAVSGGKKNYSYAWNGDGTISKGIVDSVTNVLQISQLKPGLYTVTITDDCSASVVKSVTINQPEVLTSIISSKQNITCYGGSDGSATIAVTGGNAPYVYNWNNLQNGQTAVGLFAGNYSVNVIDSKGCLSNTSVEITQPVKIGANISAIDNSCYGALKGKANVSVSGGTLPYTYIWNTGSITDSIFNVQSGTYFCTLTDACNATITKSIQISQPVELLLQFNVNNPTCSGLINGSVQVLPVGGVFPYTYLWNDSLKSTSASLSNIGAGIYAVKVTDYCGAIDSIQINVYEPQPLSVILNTTNATCNGKGNAEIATSIQGGTPPYYINWSSGQHSSIVTGLFAGYYSANVVDAQNCMSSNSTVVAEPSKLSVQESHSDVTCNGKSNGKIAIVAYGGTLSYEYKWNTGNTSDSLTNVIAGNYTVTVSNNDCKDSIVKSITISEPSSLHVKTNITNVNCFGENNGKAIIIANGGNSPYKYLFNGKNNSDTLDNLIAETYIITVTDACSSSVPVSIKITEPSALNVSTIVQNVTCNARGDGAIEAKASGGVAPYIYNWSNGFSNQKNIGLFPGTYTLNAFDSKGCLASRIITITQPNALSLHFSTIDAACNLSNGSIETVVSGGSKPYTYIWNNRIVVNKNTNLTKGKYTVTVTDSLGCTISANNDVKTFVAPTQICLITVDSITGKNKVVWEKKIDNTVDGYNIYKWGAFGYQKIGNINQSEYSVFNDALSNPKIMASRYAISVIDKCKNESALSPSHQTIFLGASQGMIPGTAVIDWTEYIDESGDFKPSEYLIYRGKTASDLKYLASVSVGTEYLDTLPLGSQYYRVIVKKNPQCVVQGILKSDSGPFSQSLSNMAESELTKVEDLHSNNALIYPNPANSYIVVHGINKSLVSIIDVQGKTLINTQIINENSISIPIESLIKGVYTVKITDLESVHFTHFIKE